MQPIQGLGPLVPVQMISASNPRAIAAETNVAGPSFKEMLLSSLQRAASIEQQGQQMAATSGGRATASSPAQSAIDRAQAAVHTATQVRDALVGAYNEIKDLRI